MNGIRLLVPSSCTSVRVRGRESDGMGWHQGVSRFLTLLSISPRRDLTLFIELGLGIYQEFFSVEQAKPDWVFSGWKPRYDTRSLLFVHFSFSSHLFPFSCFSGLSVSHISVFLTPYHTGCNLCNNKPVLFLVFSSHRLLRK